MSEDNTNKKNSIVKSPKKSSLFSGIFDDLDHVFADIFGTDEHPKKLTTMPTFPAFTSYRSRFSSRNFSNHPVKVSEDGKLLTVTVDVPGIPKDNLNVSLQNGTIVIEGKTDTRSVYYIYSLPERIDETTMSGVCENGVLVITAQLLVPQKTEKKVQISIK